MKRASARVVLSVGSLLPQTWIAQKLLRDNWPRSSNRFSIENSSVQLPFPIPLVRLKSV